MHHQRNAVGVPWVLICHYQGFWVASWTRAAQKPPTATGLVINTNIHLSTGKLHDDNVFPLQIYVAISIAMCVASTIRYFVLLKANINASRYLFYRMLAAVVGVPLAWFDSVPIGRIINRFTADFQSIDSNLGKNLGSVTSGVLQVLGIVVAVTLAVPVMMVLAPILLAASAALCYRYLTAAREMKRLEAAARSPVLDLLLSVTAGLATIRGFGRVACYMDKMHQAVDRRTRALWHLSLFNAWLSFWLNAVGAAFAALAVLLIVDDRNLDASLGGFALSFVLQFTAATDFALRRYASLELDMNALERVLDFTEIEPEAETGGVVPASWPTRGLVEVRGITARYRPEGPAVLRNVSLTLQPSERVGIVGRTGAGKSSLVLALFRLVGLSAGSIYIDGVDISTVHPRILRGRLAIVPQDPVLFAGTVRYNLDPDCRFNDSELLDLLRRVWTITSTKSTEVPGLPEDRQACCGPEPTCEGGSQATNDHDYRSGTSPAMASLTPSTSQLESSTCDGSDDVRASHAPIPSLDTPVVPGGANFSQGERQLLYLVRGLIMRPKILVLDEATSALDFRSDEHIRRLLQPESRHRYLGGLNPSILVVAHRLRTVADFDKVVVMQDGEVVEIGRPKDLLAETSEARREDDLQQGHVSVKGQRQQTAARQSRGYFRQLVQDSGDREVIERIAYRRESVYD